MTRLDAPAEGGGLSFLYEAGLHREGQGVPFVLLHGIGSNAGSWSRLMPLLPGPAYAWDAPGYGGSALQPVSTPQNYADALKRGLDVLGLDRVVLVGHSLGCLFAARFAVAQPGRVAALALLSPALGYRVAPGAALPPAVQARIDDLAELGPAAFAAKRAARLVFQPDTKPDVLRAVRDAMGAVSLPGYAAAVHALGAGDLLADAARIRVRTMVAIGAEDVVTPPANAHAVHAALPDPAPLLLVPGAGHALPQEDPAAVAAPLRSLLAEAAHHV